MKKIKVASMVLTSAMLFSTVAGVTGCHSKKSGNGVSNAVKNEVVEVEADSLWFDYSEKIIDVVSNPDKFEFCYTDSFIPVETGYVVSYTGYLPEVGSETHVVNLDKDFNIVKDSLINPKLLNLKEGTELYVNNIVASKDSVYAVVNTYFYDEETYEYESGTHLYDVVANKVVDLSAMNEATVGDSYVENVGITSNGMIYMVVYKYSENGGGYNLIFGREGELVKSLDMNKELSMKDIWSFYLMSENDGVLRFSTWDDKAQKDIIVTVDTSDWSTGIEESENEDEDVVLWGNTFTAEDGTVYSLKDDGIYEGEESVMPFACSYVNSSNVQYGTILEASDDHFVITNTFYEDNKSVLHAYVFDKAHSNPNVGKEIISVGYMGYLNDSTAEAVSLFNQNSNDYFVTLKGYNVDYDKYDYSGDWDPEKYQQFVLDEEDALINQLTLDLLNGDGPDVYVNIASLTQLNNEEYLYDISEVLDELGDVEMFDNVIDAAKVDGKLFNMPLSFTAQGIMAKTKDVKGEHGFTFEEYSEYVDKVCNGNDPMAMGMDRIDVFKILASAMNDEFFDEKGNVSFKNEAFYNLCEYCLENVPETYDWGEEGDYYYSEDNWAPAETWADGSVGYSFTTSDGLGFLRLYTIDSYIYANLKNKDAVGYYGLPSNDGRGPSIEISDSIAISAACGDYDAAKEFVKFYFGDNSETIWEDMYSNPVLLEASNANAKKCIDRNNKDYDLQLKYSTEAELASWGMFRVDYDIIEEYNELLKSAHSIAALDPSIFRIMTEELPAYFAGQKKIEDVAAVIEDRAQTVIDER